MFDHGIYDVLKMHMPPTGGSVERGRLQFYVERAVGSRCVVGGDGRLVDVEETIPHHGSNVRQYIKAMRGLFDQRPAPRIIVYNDVFDGESFNRETFERAFTHINLDSSPGYPFVYLWQNNGEVDKEFLFQTVFEVLKKWFFYGPEGINNMTPEDLFLRGLAFPAMLFVKGEPTKVSKVARLICGMSLVMNLISCILMGDYLSQLPNTWHCASHKVGLDFNTQDGLKKLFTYLYRIFDYAEQIDLDVVSDDVQGWEWMVRGWMRRAWHSVYFAKALGTGPVNLFGSVLEQLIRYYGWSLESAQKVMFHAELQLCFALVVEKMLIVDSDGYIHKMPISMMHSGEKTTHIENSDERAALAIVALDIAETEYDRDLASTNGDDCIAISDDASVSFYNLYGFNVTDRVVQTRERVGFCSQIMELKSDGEIRRYPDGMSKSLFNAVLKMHDHEALLGIYSHVREHPGFKAFRDFLQIANYFREETVELPEVREQ